MIYEDIGITNPRDRLTFFEADLAVSQTDTPLHRVATSGAAKIDSVEMVAQWDGFIVGLGYVLAANKTAGALEFNPTINGTAVTFGVVAADAALKGVKTAPANGINGVPFKKGDLIGCAYTSDANLLPAASVDVAVDMFIEYRGADRL